MGWLKKLTKPISKVLDKIIPNEIKPALPYLSAFAPYLLGPGAGGIMSNIGINNPMLQRAIMTGGINIGSQLAQEGSEGEFSGLSALLAAGQGALTAPGAEQSLRGNMVTRDPVTGDLIPMKDVAGITEGGELMKAANLPGDLEEQALLNLTAAKPATDLGMGTEGIKQLALKGGAEGAKFLGGAKRVISDPSQWGLNKETLGAFATPVTQGTGDLAMADARRALADYNAGLEEGSDAWYDDNARRIAITSAMEAGGHTAKAIEDALASLGLSLDIKDGGRVGFDTGGITNTKKIKGQDHMLAYITPNEAKKLEALGGQETMTKHGIPAYPEWDSMYGASSKASFDAGHAPKGNANWSGGGGGNNNRITHSTTPPKKKIMADPNLNWGVNIGKGLSGSDLARLFNNYYKLDMPDSDTNPNSWNYGYGLNNPSSPNFVDNITVTTPDSTITETVKDKGFLENIRDITNKTKDQLIESGILEEFKNKGGRVGRAGGGMMSVLPGGAEMDYRGGGMIPMGSKERADDVPARLSKNEFVMTADAVKAAGGGSVNRGAKRMYDLMHNLEARV